MILKKEKWTKKDIEEFNAYLKTYENSQKREWATNLLNTSLPVLCLKTQNIKDIVFGICEGNYLSFLDQMEWKYYENTAINGMLINNITDFKTYKKYLDIYSQKAENWATCDLLKFNIKGNEENFYSLAKEYVNSDKPFVKRIGLYILFEYIEKANCIKDIFDILDTLNLEEHYYVNMMAAWLLSECFIKRKEETIKYLKSNKSNKFIINKGIQKCRESRRVSVEDKDMLISYKVK